MARLDRYLLSQLLVVFGFSALVLVLIYWINRAVVLLDQLIADGQSSGVFLELTLLSLPNIIRIVLPLSAFVASLYVTNRLSTDSELIVVQATGISPWRLARPYLAFGLFAALLTLILTHFLVPASLKQLNLRQSEIAQTATARLLREGQFLTPTPGIVLYIRDVTPDGELRDIFLTDSRSAADMVTYTAARAWLVRGVAGPQLVMIDGMAQTLDRAQGRLLTTAFAEFAYDIGTLMPGTVTTRRTSRDVGTAALLWPDAALQAETGKSAAVLVAEGHDRFAQGVLAVVGPLIGLAMLLIGGFSRFGVWRQVIAAVFVIIGIKLIESVTTGLVRADATLWPLTYLPVASGLAIAAGLLHLAARPRRPIWRPIWRGVAA